MNLRITTYLSYEGDGKEIEDLVAKIGDLVSEAGFANDLEDQDASLQSLIIVKENLETLVIDPNDFFAGELENSLLRAIPAKDTKNERSGTEDSKS